MPIWSVETEGDRRGRMFLLRSIVQGKPVVRRGRKARDLHRDRPAADRIDVTRLKESITMKTNLAFFKGQGFRILLALSALASSALVIEAGQRWN
jgi:hypothetical protein